MTHKKIKKRLFQYSAGLLPAVEREKVDTHLDQCPACRAEAKGIKSQMTELKGNPPFELEDAFFAQCREEVTAACDRGPEPSPPLPDRTPSPGKRQRFGGFLAWLLNPATVAVLILLLSFLVYGAAVVKTERLIAFNLPFSLFQPLDAS